MAEEPGPWQWQQRLRHVRLWDTNEELERAFCGCISTTKAATTVQILLLFLVLFYTEDLKKHNQLTSLQYTSLSLLCVRQVRA